MCPGRGLLWLHPFRSASIVLGPIFPLKGRIGHYYAKFDKAIKTISNDRLTYQKDVEAYEALNIYGENIVGTEGSAWKRHRTIAKTAFNESNHAFVWTETIRVINEWFTELEEVAKTRGKAFTIDLLPALTQVTLLVVSSAGFGRRASWTEDSKTEPPPGHKIAFRPAVTSAVGNIITRALTPGWIYNMSEKIHIPVVTPILKETKQSFEALGLHMLDVVSQARAWIAGGKTTQMDAALLRNLVEANMAQEVDSDQRRLTDEELLSDTFVFLLAGHETSAHSLCFSIALLALYPEVQKKILEEAMKLWPDAPPTLASHTEYTWAVFHETLRLFPPVARLAKNVHSDTVLNARTFTTLPEGKIKDVQETYISVKAGSMVIIDVFGLHMNPIHWGEDVADFKPERFIDTDTYRWPRDAFVAFSAGPRSCIGQRFAITESLCVLASLVRKYEIILPDDLQGKPLEEQKRSLLHWTPSVTITPTGARVRLRLRQ
ncbi:cytochrome P450 [Crucibulum laeve]|uniref:Cytochrome P450 n=1 Tax=Crucibulum laeve TaxID=68775 RepID=A0A5C3LPB1_9AGAR|nr:cytochrome P450 [Crucibulum laeve]